jgi:hypothetical protein
MTTTARVRADEPKPRNKAKKQGPNITLRLSPKARTAWQFWCGQMGMTYEEAVWFLIEQHPIEVRVPDGVRVKPKTKEG